MMSFAEYFQAKHLKHAIYSRTMASISIVQNAHSFYMFLPVDCKLKKKLFLEKYCVPGFCLKSQQRKRCHWHCPECQHILCRAGTQFN